MRKLWVYILTLLSSVGLSVAAHADCVILLHGLARSSHAMNKLETNLAQHYQVINVDYPSREHPIEALAVIAIEPALLQCSDTTVHFVTHSMGGIIIRQYLAHHTISQLGRIVMLGPPNQGSEVIDTLDHWPSLEWLNGPAGKQLGTSANSIPLMLGEITAEVGIIAGDRSINLILSAIIPGPDDGKVAVERTKLNSMKDHITLHVTHPFMMKNKAVIQQVNHFLQYGKFDRNNNNNNPTTD